MDGVNVVSPAFFSIMKGSNGEINDNACLLYTSYLELQKSSKKFKVPKEAEKLKEYKEIIKKYILENL